MAATAPLPYVALLRGVNVGGKNRLPMADLVAMLEALGCTELETYIQSGNATFRLAPVLQSVVVERLRAEIRRRYSYDLPVLLRSHNELEAAVEANPFPEAVSTPDQLMVMFLSAAPARERIETLDLRRSPPDRCLLHGQELYLHCPQGFARTRFTNGYFDRTLGVASTGRNWRTVTELLRRLRLLLR